MRLLFLIRTRHVPRHLQSTHVHTPKRLELSLSALKVLVRVREITRGLSEGRYEHAALAASKQTELELGQSQRLQALLMRSAEIEEAQDGWMRPLLLHEGDAQALGEPAGYVPAVICCPAARPTALIHVLGGDSGWA